MPEAAANACRAPRCGALPLLLLLLTFAEVAVGAVAGGVDARCRRRVVEGLWLGGPGLIVVCLFQCVEVGDRHNVLHIVLLDPVLGCQLLPNVCPGLACADAEDALEGCSIGTCEAVHLGDHVEDGLLLVLQLLLHSVWGARMRWLLLLLPYC